MSIELTILISVLSVAAAIYFGLSSKRRNDRQDTQRETADMTTVVVKLENIGNGINEIKGDMRNVRDEVRNLGERQAKTEESLKSAWNRINEIVRLKGSGG
ncbi:MAG: hypothetical protein PHY64_00220 [Eubacteriales bacterium]|nr:hypothetical protein [Eubacteriales bacterium]